MKIYTRRGDDGRTDLFGGRRVAKTHPRVSAYGTVDELNAALGLAATHVGDPDLRESIEGVQAQLFHLGADIATPSDTVAGGVLKRASPSWVTALEHDIDTMDTELQDLSSFIVPGGTTGAAALHLGRTICRRAERRVAEVMESGEVIDPIVLSYLNRLSDWLFTAARLANHRSGVPERCWRGTEDRST